MLESVEIATCHLVANVEWFSDVLNTLISSAPDKAEGNDTLNYLDKSTTVWMKSSMDTFLKHRLGQVSDYNNQSYNLDIKMEWRKLIKTYLFKQLINLI